MVKRQISQSSDPSASPSPTTTPTNIGKTTKIRRSLGQFGGVRFLLDILSDYLWYEPSTETPSPETRLYEELNSSNGEWEENQMQRPSFIEIKELRKHVLEILWILVKEAITVEETKSILDYLYNSSLGDNKQLPDVFQVFANNLLLLLTGIQAFIVVNKTKSSNN